MATRSIVPRLNNEGSIGTAAKWWSDAYFVGMHVSSGVFSTNKFAPNVDNQFNLGDGTHRFANAYSVFFYGTATVARYSDLAEKYSCKEQVLPEGTVLCIAKDNGVDVEVCDEDACDCVVGAVSTKPAYLMNEQAKGPAVGLVGRIPVRVIGPIRKRQAIVSAGKGCARAAEGNSDYMFNFGFAIEENLDSGEKLVMCIVK